MRINLGANPTVPSKNWVNLSYNVTRIVHSNENDNSDSDEGWDQVGVHDTRGGEGRGKEENRKTEKGKAKTQQQLTIAADMYWAL